MPLTALQVSNYAHQGIRYCVELAAEYSDQQRESLRLVVTEDSSEGVASQPNTHRLWDSKTGSLPILLGDSKLTNNCEIGNDLTHIKTATNNSPL